MKKVLGSIKKQFKQVGKHPKIAIAAGLVLVVLISGLITVVVIGGDDDPSTATTGTGQSKDSDDDKDPQSGARKKPTVKPAPVISGSGTLDSARREGRLALAQARGRIKTPASVRVRVSAAPKQTVTVDWQLSCYKVSGGTSSTRAGNGRYLTRPPNVRELPLPMSGADECTATVGAQLTRGSGRIKVAVLAG
ncbi:MAG: hypothetical protein WKF42_04110 [Solirubrobacteraceae bacterium]